MKLIAMLVTELSQLEEKFSVAKQVCEVNINASYGIYVT